MASTRRPRVSRHTLGVGSLFPPEAVFQDTDGDGYPDRLGLCLAVDPRLADAGMWAELINLAARLAGEVVALDRAIVLPLAKAPDDRPCLVITAPDRTGSAPAVFHNHGPHRVTLTGNSAAVMAAVLHSLAVCPFMANVIPHDWRAIQAGSDNTEALDVVGRRGRIIERIRLAPSSTVLPEQRLPQPPADLLELDAGLTHVSAEDPRRRRLLLTLELDRRRVSAPVGFALAGFVARAALAATEIAASPGLCRPSGTPGRCVAGPGERRRTPGPPVGGPHHPGRGARGGARRLHPRLDADRLFPWRAGPRDVRALACPGRRREADSQRRRPAVARRPRGCARPALSRKLAFRGAAGRRRPAPPAGGHGGIGRIRLGEQAGGGAPGACGRASQRFCAKRATGRG